jgi:hypothetical protein
VEGGRRLDEWGDPPPHPTGLRGQLRTSRVGSVLGSILVWAAIGLNPPVAAGQSNPSESSGSLGTVLVANALLSGTVAGIAAILGGHSPGAAFLEGAQGGTLSFAGKLVAARPELGGGLVGRPLAALGSSWVANAARGRGRFAEVLMPFGPLRLSRTGGHGVRVGVSGTDLLVIAIGVLSQDWEWDWSTTISSGTPVFRVRSGGMILDRDRVLDGAAIGGVVFMANQPAAPLDQVLGHELVHVIQADWVEIVASQEADRTLLGLLGWGDLESRVTVNTVGLLGAWASRRVDWLAAGIEWEAESLEKR